MRDTSIVILGGAGMLGHKLFQSLRERFRNTVATIRNDAAQPPLNLVTLLHGPDVLPWVDVTHFHLLRTQLEKLKPDFIVNCVGIVKQRNDARNDILCITINSLLPHRLAQAAAKWGGRVIHFSTDCVFSGRRGHYRENDASDADDLYGRSKFLGEVATANAITLRTSIIGRELTEHRSLLDWFLSQKGRSVRGYRRVIYSGITTNEMANVVTRIIADLRGLSGLFHVVSEPITKYQLLVLIREAYGLDVAIEPDDREVSDRSMCGNKFREASGWCAPSWPEMVRELAADPTPYREWGASVLSDGAKEARACSNTERS